MPESSSHFLDYRGAMGILLMYDVTSLDSFNNLSYWLRNIQEVTNNLLLNAGAQALMTNFLSQECCSGCRESFSGKQM
jgi:GTPase SAR1 family protein